MRRTTPLALAAAALILAGCGSQQGTGSSDKVSAPPRGGTPSPTRSAGDCTGRAELTAADHGRTVCVAEGGEVRLSLDGTGPAPGSRSPPTVRPCGRSTRASSSSRVTPRPRTGRWPPAR